MFKDSFEFRLEKGLQYAKHGEIQVTDTLLLFAPCVNNMDSAAEINKEWAKAVVRNSEKKATDSPATETPESTKIEPPTADQIVSFLYGSEVVNIKSVFSSFKKMLTNGGCVIPPVEPTLRINLTSDLCDKLTLKDFQGMLGAYIINFLM